MTPEERFWAKVDKSGGPDACWPWTGSCIKGYGRLYLGVRSTPRAVYAHRYSYELANGPIPEGQSICHRCDYPACVNPSHLFAGTQTDNMRDMGDKGRGGGQNGTHCKEGHRWTDATTGWFFKKANGRRTRFCRPCHNRRVREYRKRLKEAACH